MLTSAVLAVSSKSATSGRVRRCCKHQNMNAQCAVSDKLHTRIVSTRRATDRPFEKFDHARLHTQPAFDLAACHSSGSGTARRIHSTSSAGRMPTRNTKRLGDAEEKCVPHRIASGPRTMAMMTPIFTAVCKVAATHGRHCLGHVSDSSDAPTAHSPPMPSAARNRKMNNCHQVWAKNDRPVKAA